MSRLTEGWRRAQRSLARPVDAASLGAFRIVFGLTLLWHVVWYAQRGLIAFHFTARDYHFTYPGFGWVQPWPGAGMHIHFALLGAASLLLALGLFYRWAAAAFFFLYTYEFLIDQTAYNNHYYFISLLGLLFLVSDAHRFLSVDAARKGWGQCGLVPRWQILLFKLQVFIVYFYAGVAKFDPDWLRGQPMRMALEAGSPVPILSELPDPALAAILLNHAGLAFDLSIGFLLWWGRSRVYAFFALLAFHLFNSWVFTIGIFPYLMIGACVLFAEPGTVRRWLARLPWLGKMLGASEDEDGGGAEEGAPRLPAAGSRRARLAAGFFVLYLAVQILVPFRHWLYPGYVSWTEEGHLFSWRMKLRDKRGYLRVFVSHPATGETWRIDLTRQLTQRQIEIMMIRPALIHQYVQSLRARITRDVDPVIRVHSALSLNGRPPRLLIDPQADLAAEPYPVFGHAHWLLPLEDEK